MSKTAVQEILETKPRRCHVCKISLTMPFAELNSGVVALSESDDAPYGEAVLFANGHAQELFSLEEEAADLFMKEAKIFALDLKRYLRAARIVLTFESLDEKHLVARMTPRYSEGAVGVSKDKLFQRLLTHYTAYEYLKLSESFLVPLKPKVPPKPVASKVIFLNRNDPQLADRLRDHLYRTLRSLDHTRILEASSAILGTTALRELETGIYSIQWNQKPLTVKPRAVQKILRRVATVQKSSCVELFYRDSLHTRTVSLKSADDRGFLAFTPHGYRRFLWEHVRGIGEPSPMGVSREIIRMNRYVDGSVNVVRENFYRTRTEDASS